MVLTLYKKILKTDSFLGLPIDRKQKWLPLNYSFVGIKNCLTKLVLEIKILKNLLFRTRLVRLF